MTLDAGARRGAPMSDVGSAGTRGGSALSVGTTIRHVSVHGQRVRVAVRPGSGAGTPLVLCCGLGAGLEVFQPVIDALPAEVEVIRFDVPGVGGSPTGPLHYRFGLLPGRRPESHRPPPTDPDVSLSAHPARAVQCSGVSTAAPSARTGRVPVAGLPSAIPALVCRCVSAACTSTSPSAPDGCRCACRWGSPRSDRTR